VKVAAYYGKKDIRLVDVPIPEVKDEGILIKIKTCGVCGSDLHVFKEGKFLKDSSIEIGGFRVLGHEFAGEVVEVGSKVEDFQLGDRVICAHTKGGFAEYIHIEKAQKNLNVFHLPDSISYRTAATLEPLFASYHGVMISVPEVGDTTVVIGCGIIGLGVIQILKSFYFTRIVCIDLSEKRLETAKRLGAEHFINPRAKNLIEGIAEITGTAYVRYLDYRSPLADIVYECAGASTTPSQAFKISRPINGRVVTIALYEKESFVDFNDVVMKSLTIYGMLGYSEKDILQVLQLVGAGKIEREFLISHEFSLQDIQKGFQSQLQLNESIKAVIYIDKNL